MKLLEERSFLEKITPFNQLDSSSIEKIVSNFDILYFKKDATILEPKKDVEYLYFIIKGVVQELNDKELISVYCKNEFFDPVSLIENRTKHQFIATDECICYAINRDTFLEVLYKNEILEEYFFATIADKLNLKQDKLNRSKIFDFAIAKVHEVYLREPLYVDSSASIADVAKLLKSNGRKVALVKDGDSVGIVTYSDFVKKAIANGLDLNSSILEITTFDLVSIEKDDFLFNAQLLMNSHNIDQVVVKDGSKIIAILDLILINSFFATHSYIIHKQIENASSVEQLKEASSKFIDTIRVMHEKDIKARYIAKLVSQLNEKLLDKLFMLTAPDELINSSCLIVMGSEGRGEQILKTDQDNALIVAKECKVSKDEIMSFAKGFSANLIEFGYPPCPGNIMVSNPAWCKGVDEFKKDIYSWVYNPSEQSSMNLAIFLDAKVVSGDSMLLSQLKEYLNKVVTDNGAFLANFAKATLQFDTPIGLFTNFIVNKNQHKGELDIKKGAIFPIVHGIRSLSLEQKIESTNTFERVKELNNQNLINKEFASELIEAFDFLLKLRLRFRLDKIDKGLEEDNYINPNNLSTLERDLLKDCFKVVNEFKKLITHHFKLSYV